MAIKIDEIDEFRDICIRLANIPEEEIKRMDLDDLVAFYLTISKLSFAIKDFNDVAKKLIVKNELKKFGN